jgi:hypothetical protein
MKISSLRRFSGSDRLRSDLVRPRADTGPTKPEKLILDSIIWTKLVPSLYRIGVGQFFPARVFIYAWFDF